MKTSIYLDHNATTPLRPAAIEGVLNALQIPANASSIHEFGRTGRKWIETARVSIARLAGTTAKNVIFNGGATEGNNTVLHAFSGSRLLISATEHSSVYQTGNALNAEKIPVTSTGQVDLDALEKLCKTGPTPALISVMYVNNETGVINDMTQVAAIARAYGAILHVDAVQAAGKIKIDMRETEADFLTLSAHKIGGPQGVGALIIAGDETRCIAPPVLITGGGQERSLRAGTENVAGIVGFGIAATQALNEIDALNTRLMPWRQLLEKTLLNSSPRVRLHGTDAPRVSNTICFSVENTEAQTLLMNLDLMGVALSSGSACSSGKVRTSHVLQAMGIPETQAKGALRLSMGYTTTKEQIDRFVEIWQKVAERF